MKRKVRWKRLGIAAAALLLLYAAAAGADAPARLTLEDAISRALSRNPALAAQRSDAEAASWRLREARGYLLPSLSVDSRYTRLDDETVARANVLGRRMTMYFPDSMGVLQPFTIEIPQTVFRHGYETSISGQLLLFQPSVWNAVSQAANARSIADTEVTVIRQETAYQTLRGFVELLKIHSLIGVQQRHVALARDSRALAERLHAVGRYAEADVLRWRVEEARQNQLLVQLQSSRQVAALALENLMGDRPAGTVVPDTVLPARLVRELEQFRSLNTEAWERFAGAPLEEVVALHPQLDLLKGATRAAEIEHTQSRLSFLPSVAITGAYGWQQNDTAWLDGERAWSVSAVLSMPIFTGFRNVSAHEATKHRLRAARENLHLGQRAVLLAAETARTAIRSYTEQLRLVDASLASARRNYEIHRNNRELGRLSNLEWIDALVALQTAEQNRTAAYYDLVLAVADYYQATGRILALLGY